MRVLVICTKVVTENISVLKLLLSSTRYTLTTFPVREGTAFSGTLTACALPSPEAITKGGESRREAVVDPLHVHVRKMLSLCNVIGIWCVYALGFDMLYFAVWLRHRCSAVTKHSGRYNHSVHTLGQMSKSMGLQQGE